MKSGAFHYLYLKPGGWPYSAGNPPKEGQAIPVYPKREPLTWYAAIAAFLLFIVFPLSYGFGYAWRFYLVLALPLLCLLPARALRHLMFADVPAVEACLLPKNQTLDLRRTYKELILSVSSVWFSAAIVLLHSILSLKSGMGEQWNPFTRTIHVTKTGPFSEYFIFEWAMFVSGLIAITGLLWWPMYVLFEWLDAKKKIKSLSQGVAQNA